MRRLENPWHYDFDKDGLIDIEWIPRRLEKNSVFRTLSGGKVIAIKKYEKRK